MYPAIEVKLHSNYDDAVVFINGQSTGKMVKDLETFGPVAADGSVKIHAEITVEGQTLKSGEISVTQTGQSVNLQIDDSSIREAKARAEAQKRQAEKALAEDTEEIENVIHDHYASISYGYFSIAYDIFSSSRKQEIPFSSWAEGLTNNLSNDVKGVKVEAVNGNQATASFEMVSRDSMEGGGTFVQTWTGKWHLTKENSFWKLDDPEISKINERME